MLFNFVCVAAAYALLFQDVAGDCSRPILAAFSNDRLPEAASHIVPLDMVARTSMVEDRAALHR